MVREYEEKGTLKVTVLARVASHGTALYLYIPKDIAEAYGIVAGDKVEVQFLRHFKPVNPEAEESGLRSSAELRKGEKRW